MSGGQRIVTVLMYLNQPEAGGGTLFRKLGLEIKPSKGMAAIFFPGRPASLPSPASHRARLGHRSRAR